MLRTYFEDRTVGLRENATRNAYEADGRQAEQQRRLGTCTTQGKPFRSRSPSPESQFLLKLRLNFLRAILFRIAWKAGAAPEFIKQRGSPKLAFQVR